MDPSHTIANPVAPGYGGSRKNATLSCSDLRPGGLSTDPLSDIASLGTVEEGRSFKSFKKVMDLRLVTFSLFRP